ncbi:MAG: NUDIX hydrolase [bacterium]|nr:NUDIX hydrolase [bacterium]
MLQPNTFYRTSIKALVFDENKKILLTKDEGTNKWDFPGGGMDWGEAPQECLAREIEEEMDIKTTWIADRPAYFFPFLSEKDCKGARIL